MTKRREHRQEFTEPGPKTLEKIREASEWLRTNRHKMSLKMNGGHSIYATERFRKGGVA